MFIERGSQMLGALNLSPQKNLPLERHGETGIHLIKRAKNSGSLPHHLTKPFSTHTNGSRPRHAVIQKKAGEISHPAFCYQDKRL